MSLSMSELSITEADLIALEAEGLHGASSPRGEKVNDIPRYLLPPEDCRFDESDMVWGKVKSHPWWPAQIFDPADASDEALKNNYKDGFLVAYFGNRSYAWNDVTTLRPYRSYFSQMSRQSGMANFSNAVDCSVDEVSRRVELGLTCYCTPSEVYAKFESQRIDNVGIRDGACVADGAYGPYNMMSFEPDRLVEYIGELALSPLGGFDKLDLTIAKTQVQSFYRSKGYFELPSFSVKLAWPNVENEHSRTESALVAAVNLVEAETPEPKKRKTKSVSSGKRKFSEDGAGKTKKQKSLADLMESKVADPTDIKDDGKVGSLSMNSGRFKKRKVTLKDVEEANTPVNNNSFKIGACISKIAVKLTRSTLTCKRSDRKVQGYDEMEESELGDLASNFSPTAREVKKDESIAENSPIKEMLSQLHLVAQNPLKPYSFVPEVMSFFSDYWNSSRSTEGIKKMNDCQSCVKIGKSESDADDSAKSEDFGDLDSMDESDIISEGAEKNLESGRAVEQDDDEFSEADFVEVFIDEVVDDVDILKSPANHISEETEEGGLELDFSVMEGSEKLSSATVVDVFVNEVVCDLDFVKDPDVISGEGAEKQTESDFENNRNDEQLSNADVFDVSGEKAVKNLDSVKEVVSRDEVAKELESESAVEEIDDQISYENVDVSVGELVSVFHAEKESPHVSAEKSEENLEPDPAVSVGEVVSDFHAVEDSYHLSDEKAEEKLESDPAVKKDSGQLSNTNVVDAFINEVFGSLDLVNNTDLTSEEEAEEKLESIPSDLKDDGQLSNENAVALSINQLFDDLDFVKDADYASEEEAEKKVEPDPSSIEADEHLSNSSVAKVTVNEIVEEHSDTALILKFSEVHSLPSLPDLIKIYSQYGQLLESETEVVREANHAKVVFKKKAHAEVAFSSTGKFCMIDPPPVSYHLRYSPFSSKTADTGTKSGSEKEEAEEGSCPELVLTEYPSTQMDDAEHGSEIAFPIADNGLIPPQYLSKSSNEGSYQTSQLPRSEMHLGSGADQPSVLPANNSGESLVCGGGGQPLLTSEPKYPPPTLVSTTDNTPLDGV